MCCVLGYYCDGNIKRIVLSLYDTIIFVFPGNSRGARHLFRTTFIKNVLLDVPIHNLECVP